MASTTWRIQGVDTGRADLVLSALHLWDAAGVADTGAVVTCSHAPSEGVLANLTDGDPETQCAWAAKDVSAPGFYIQWVLPTAKSIWSARATGVAKTNFLRFYTLSFYAGDRWVSQRQGQIPWPGIGVLSVQRETAPVFVYDTEWGSIATAKNTYGLAVSGDGQTQMYAESGAGAQGFITKDGGLTWSVAAGLTVGANGFGSGAASYDGSILAIGGYGGATSKLNLSTDGGTTWVKPSITFTAGVYATAVSGDGNTILACDPVGTSYISRDRGATWSAVSAPKGSASGFSGAAVSVDGSTIIVSGYGSSAAQVSISKDGGGTWTPVSGLSVASTGFEGCSMSDDGRVMLAVGAGLSAVRVNMSTDYGATWAPVGTVVASSGFAGCAVSGDGQVLLVCGFGVSTEKVFSSKDGGVTWAAETGITPGPSGFSRCAVSTHGTVMLVTSQSLRVAARAGRDRVYEEPTLQTEATGPQAFAQGDTPAQGLGPMGNKRGVFVKDTEFGGDGRVYGVVERKNTPANVPLRRRVRLHRSRDGQLVRETWSKADGSYEFKGISMEYEYDTIAWDHEMSYRSVIANNLKPEAM